MMLRGLLLACLFAATASAAGNDWGGAGVRRTTFVPICGTTN